MTVVTWLLVGAACLGGWPRRSRLRLAPPGTTAEHTLALSAQLARLGARLDAGLVPGTLTVDAVGPPADLARVCLEVSRVTGCPLREAIDIAAAGVHAQEELTTAREVAMAGPRLTAWVLAALPAAGIGLGYLLGADPVAVMLTGGPGAVAALVAVALVAAGMWWSRRMISHCAREVVA